MGEGVTDAFGVMIGQEWLRHSDHDLLSVDPLEVARCSGDTHRIAAGVGEGVAVRARLRDFFELEQERLLRVLWLVTGSLQEAEDIVQDTFLG